VFNGALRRSTSLVNLCNHGRNDWRSLLREIGEYLKGTAVALTYHDFQENRGVICFSSGYNLQYANSYASHHSRQNAWLARESDYRPEGTIHIGEHLVPEAKLMMTELYRDWLQPQNLHHRLCAVLSRDGATAVFLEVMRPQAGMRFDQDDIKAYHVLVPHLQRLLRMHYRIVGLETERDAALHALDYLPWGVILIDSYGNRLAANCRAQEILAAREGLMVHGDSVRAVLRDESVRLDRLLSSALEGTKDGAGGTLSITRPLKASPLIVVVVPLRSQSEGLPDRAPAVGIFMSDPDVRLDGSEQHLRELYALTVVEARLATRLLQGKSIDEAAAEMGVTVNTTRAYLKRIYCKIGVRRQSELMRRLLLGPTGLNLTDNQRDPGRHDAAAYAK
jgi:DNA-binding CsgD family transcriptional regulator